MSETHDIFETETTPYMPAIPPKPSEFPLDFGPLIDSDTDDFELNQAPLSSSRPAVRRRLFVWLSIALVIILLGAGLFTYRNFTRPPAVTYTQATASVGNLAVTASGTGPVQPAAIYNLNFGASAPIATINVHVGQQVKQGDVLATLDPTALQDAINQAQNTVNTAQTSLNIAATNLSNTKTQQATALNIAALNEQKALNACASSTTSQPAPNATPTPVPTPDPNCVNLAKAQFTQAQQQANAAIANASNQVTSAQQQLTNAQTALQTAQNNLQNTRLLAPHDGVVEVVNGLVGETAGGAGNGGNGGSANGSSAFIVLVDTSTLSVAAQINEANIASVAVNQPATFTVAAYPSQTFRASVSSIDTLGSTTSNVVTYLVNLAVNMQSLSNAHLYPGMTATVNITTAERIGTLLVPSAALSFSTTAIQNGELSRNALRSLISGVQPGAGAASGSRGIVVELKNGQLVPVLVTTGLSNGQFTEILSGLNEGDQIIVSQTGGSTTPAGNGFPGGRGGNGGGNRFFGGGGN